MKPSIASVAEHQHTVFIVPDVAAQGAHSVVVVVHRVLFARRVTVIDLNRQLIETRPQHEEAREPDAAAGACVGRCGGPLDNADLQSGASAHTHTHTHT